MYLTPKPGCSIAVVVHEGPPNYVYVSLTRDALIALLAGETVASGKYVSARMVPDPEVPDAG